MSPGERLGMAECGNRISNAKFHSNCWPIGSLPDMTTGRTTEACLLLFFYEILVDSTLTTRRIGEQKFSCVQFAHNVASEVIENFRIFV